jgi:hypothetical protein
MPSLSKTARGGLCARLRTPLRLCASPRRVQFKPVPRIQDINRTVPELVHRYQESIGGRLYHIEVAAVATDRWRACIVRVPGVPTALMPFYGRTPDEAAHQLTGWLTRAHVGAGSPTPSV